MDQIKKYLSLFEHFLSSHPLTRQPVNLYQPADYILSLGGKRIRPVFVLLGCDLYAQRSDDALNAAMAIEVFHNFTLLHDDIMDKADLRRGQPTVHKKYGTNTAILSGDVMMIQAYQYLMEYKDPFLLKNILHVFNKMAFEVCEGQQMDMDFEHSENVTIADYIQMITYKTSVLMAASMQIGGLIGGAEESDQKHLYEFAKNFGIAFQLQDDILDTFGEHEQVGKKIGGDILQNKKTYLLLKTMELADPKQKSLLQQLYSSNEVVDGNAKISKVTEIYKSVNVLEYAKQVIEAYRDLSISHLMSCNIDETKKKELSSFINEMIFRSY